MDWRRSLRHVSTRNPLDLMQKYTPKMSTIVGEVLKHVLPQDFVKFGLIPEFIGRVPVTVTLDMLDKDAMIRILCEPKNALVKQYKKLFELDGVSLEFDRECTRSNRGQSA